MTTHYRMPRHPFPHLAPNEQPHALSAVVGAARRLGIARRVDHTVLTGRTDPAQVGRFEIEGLREGGGRTLRGRRHRGDVELPVIRPHHHRRPGPLPPGIHPKDGAVW